MGLPNDGEDSSPARPQSAPARPPRDLDAEAAAALERIRARQQAAAPVEAPAPVVPISEVPARPPRDLDAEQAADDAVFAARKAARLDALEAEGRAALAARRAAAMEDAADSDLPEDDEDTETVARWNETEYDEVDENESWPPTPSYQPGPFQKMRDYYEYSVSDTVKGALYLAVTCAVFWVLLGTPGCKRSADSTQQVTQPAPPPKLATSHPQMKVQGAQAVPTADGGLYVATDNGPLWFVLDGVAAEVIPQVPANPFGFADRCTPTADGGLYYADDSDQLWYLNAGKARKVIADQTNVAPDGRRSSNHLPGAAFAIAGWREKRLREKLGNAELEIEDLKSSLEPDEGEPPDPY